MDTVDDGQFLFMWFWMDLGWRACMEICTCVWAKRREVVRLELERLTGLKDGVRRRRRG